MGLAEQVATLLKREPVGRVYLEDVDGQRVQVLWVGTEREPQVRFRGKVYTLSARLPEGWLYRTTDAWTGSAASDGFLTEACGPMDDGFVWPSDWPAKPDPEGEAIAACAAAITALGRFAGQRERAARLTQVWSDADQHSPV